MATPNSSNGLKRKRTTEPKFYAVHVGQKPGIYYDWQECLSQVKGFKGAVYKSFSSLSEAESFVAKGLGARTSSKGPPKFYGVQSGKVPGVYASWDEASVQVTGCTKPKYKAFLTRAEAEAYVSGGPASQSNGDAPAQDNTPSKSSSKKKKAKPWGSGSGDENTSYGPGEGPLPADAEDGFDPILTYDSTTGTVEYKSEEQLKRTKPQANGVADGQFIKIWTDGSSRGNGKQGAIAGVGVYFGPGDRRNIAEPLSGPRQTNQRAELTAILRALELSPRDQPVMILSDSEYAINCVTTWFRKWVSNGWVNAAKKPVENKDLIEKILGYIKERERISNMYSNGAGDDDGEVVETAKQHSWNRGRARVEFTWVKGHANEEGNVAADALAVAGARKARDGMSKD